MTKIHPVIDPLASVRRLIHGPRDAVRWACLLEATAPKAGNVYPGRPFDNLTYADFVAAADIAANRLASRDECLSLSMLRTVEETVRVTKTNVNLGIVLLLGPLVAADGMLSASGGRERTVQGWFHAIGEVLENFDGLDGQNIYRAIQTATAGGLGTVESMDVHATSEPVDLLEAMKLAEDRDRIARQYATGFADLIDVIVPVLWESITETGDMLGGICRGHLRLLTMEPDSLIARKNGWEVAASVQKRAQKVDLEDPESLQKFDDSLRGASHKFNPGTTADLISGALYILLRTPIL